MLMAKWTEKEEEKPFLYCFTSYFADPATFLATSSVLGTLFFSGNSLFIQLQQHKCICNLDCYLIDILNIKKSEFEFLLQNYTVPL